MPAIEKTLYLLFLRQPESIYLSSLADHRKELYQFYSYISKRGTREDMKRRFDEMTNILREQVSLKLSRINRAFF